MHTKLDPLTHDLLTDEISRIVSTTSGVRPIKRDFFTVISLVTFARVTNWQQSVVEQ